MIDDNGGDVPGIPHPAAAAAMRSQQALIL
jgi:hypothetical protein